MLANVSYPSSLSCNILRFGCVRFDSIRVCLCASVIVNVHGVCSFADFVSCDVQQQHQHAEMCMCNDNDKSL